MLNSRQITSYFENYLSIYQMNSNNNVMDWLMARPKIRENTP